jgi:hypothetical protein
VSAAFRRWLTWPGRIAWRWISGKELNGVPRTDATWLARGTATLDPDAAAKPPQSLREEIRSDVAAVREEIDLRRRGRRVKDAWDARTAADDEDQEAGQ